MNVFPRIRYEGHRPCPDCDGPLYGREGDCGNEECPYHYKVLAREQVSKERAARLMEIWRTEMERVRCGEGTGNMNHHISDLDILRAVQECGEAANMHTVESHLNRYEMFFDDIFEVIDRLHVLEKEELLISTRLSQFDIPKYRLTAAGRTRLEKG